MLPGAPILPGNQQMFLPEVITVYTLMTIDNLLIIMIFLIGPQEGSVRCLKDYHFNAQ